MHPAWISPGLSMLYRSLIERIAQGNTERAYVLAREIAHYVRAVDSRNGKWSR